MLFRSGAQFVIGFIAYKDRAIQVPVPRYVSRGRTAKDLLQTWKLNDKDAAAFTAYCSSKKPDSYHAAHQEKLRVYRTRESCKTLAATPDTHKWEGQEPLQTIDPVTHQPRYVYPLSETITEYHDPLPTSSYLEQENDAVQRVMDLEPTHNPDKEAPHSFLREDVLEDRPYCLLQSEFGVVTDSYSPIPALKLDAVEIGRAHV